MHKRGQSSLEFILTYGWVFFIVLAGVGVIYSSGIVTISDFLPDSCNFIGQMHCVDAQMVSTGSQSANVNFVLTNGFAVNLVIYNATLKDAYGVSCTGLLERPVIWPQDSSIELNLTGCSGATLLKNSRYEGDILVTFYRNSSWCESPISNLPGCLYTSIGSLRTKIN